MRTTLITVCVCLTLAGCGSTSTSEHEPVSSLDAVGAAPVSRVAWSDEGQRLIEAKTDAYARSPQYAAHAGGWLSACQSDPIDIATPGRYALTFSSIGSDFDFPTSPASFAMNTPPDAAFDVLVQDAVMSDTADGRRQFVVTVSIHERTGFAFEAYPAFTVWIY